MTTTADNPHLFNHLFVLPDELFFMIVEYLDASDITVLTRTSYRLWIKLTPSLYRLAEDGLPRNGGSVLDWAAQRGLMDTAISFLKYARPKTSLDQLVYSALEVASTAGFENMVRFFLQVELNPTFHTRQMHLTQKNFSALFCAAAGGHTRIVQLLLEAKTEVLTPTNINDCRKMLIGTIDEEGEVLRADTTIPQLLILHGFNVNVIGNRGDTLLHYMAECGHAPLVAMLLELDLDINRRDRDGRTPLHCATGKARHHVMRLLLQAGADPEIRDNEGGMAIHVAALQFSPDTAQILLAHGANVNAQSLETGKTPLHVAAEHPHRPLCLIEALVDGGALVTMQDFHGRTPLVLTVWNGSPAVVMYLIRKGALDDPSSWTPELLLWAAKMGYEEIVKRLLDSGIAPDSLKDTSDCTPLMLAVKSGNQRVFRLILQKTTDVDALDREGRTALFYAAKIKNEEMVQTLLEKARQVDYSDQDGLTPLMIAIHSRVAGVFSRILLVCREFDHVDCRGRTALHHAVVTDNFPATEALLHKSKALNEPDHQGSTPLVLAARYERVSTAALLLKNGGIDINEKDALGYTALTWAIKTRSSAMVSLLLEHEAKIEESFENTHPRHLPSLIEATVSGHSDIVRKLLHHGAKLEVRDSAYQTPLIHAARHGFTGIMEMLLWRNADMHACDNELRNALFYAAHCGHKPIVDLLLERGAAVEHRDAAGRTPIAAAARHGYTEIVKELLAHGAYADSQDRHQKTPLLIAAMNGSSSVIEALLPYRVNVNHVDFYCRTALSLAAEGGFPDVIKLLLGQAEIDLEISDRMGRTSLTWAAQGGNMEVVKLLTEAGADVVKGDKSGRTPLSWVLEYGHTKLIKYLIKISP